jgi:hypothetical protein
MEAAWLALKDKRILMETKCRLVLVVLLTVLSALSRIMGIMVLLFA